MPVCLTIRLGAGAAGQRHLLRQRRERDFHDLFPRRVERGLGVVRFESERHPPGVRADLKLEAARHAGATQPVALVGPRRVVIELVGVLTAHQRRRPVRNKHTRLVEQHGHHETRHLPGAQMAPNVMIAHRLVAHLDLTEAGSEPAGLVLGCFLPRAARCAQAGHLALAVAG